MKKAQQNSYLYLFQVVGLIAFFLMLLPGLGTFDGYFLTHVFDQPLFFLGFILFPLMGIASTLYLMHKSVQAKPLFYLHTASIVVALLVVTLAISSMVYEKPPVLFPLHDPNATFAITKDSDRFFVEFDTTTPPTYNSMTCEYIKGKRICKKAQDLAMTHVLIASSPVDLDPYIGKKLDLKGRFVYTEEQCIVTKCIHTGRFVGFKIERIDVK